MSRKTKTPWHPSNPEGLAKQFSRLGWIGFWLQLALIVIPVLLFIYLVFFSGPDSAQRRGIELSNYLSYGGLLVMVFTTLWFYRYTRLAARIAEPAKRPTFNSVLRTVWIGVWASCLGILFSMLLLISAVVRLLFVLMTMPQTGIPVAAIAGADPARTLSAIDAASLTSLLIMLTAELIVLAFSLWLLFRVYRAAPAEAEAAAGEEGKETPSLENENL